MTKSTDKQKKQVMQKNTRSNPKKRGIEENIDKDSDVKDSTKKMKDKDGIDANMNDAITSKKADDEENIVNGSSESKNFFESIETINNLDDISEDDNTVHSSKTDVDNEIEHDDELLKDEVVDPKPLVPILKSRENLIQKAIPSPPTPTDVKETVLYARTSCESMIGFDSAGKRAMMENLNERERIVLRGYIRKEGFKMLKFLSPAELSMNSGIMGLLYEQIGTTCEKEKIKKYLGVRYILQRQLNGKRNYCIEKIVKQLKGMFFFFGCVLMYFFLLTMMLRTRFL